MKIAISPSSQEHNLATDGGTEETRMRVVCAILAHELTMLGHEARVFTGTMQEQIAAAIAWGPGLILEVHSNAGGGHGVTTSIHHNDNGIRTLTARAINANIAALDPHFRNRGVGVNGDTFGAIRMGEAKPYYIPTLLVETLFHDCPIEAAFIRDQPARLAKAMADAINSVTPAQVPQPDQGAPVPVPNIPTPPTPAPAPAPLGVDGSWGTNTTLAWQKRRGLAGDGSMGGQSIMDAQRRFGTAVDGMVSGQATRSHLPSWVKDRVKIGTGGSRLIRAIAADLEAHGYATNGSDRDGLAGSGFVKAVQRRINTDPNYLKG